jgi:hypothetical protein
VQITHDGSMGWARGWCCESGVERLVLDLAR